MRVIAGEMRGRRILAPPGRATRPTTDRAREALFSVLESLGALAGATVWDLFAGSGALGIEALSRGAAYVTFVDRSPRAIAATRSNLASLGLGPERATVVLAEVASWVGAAPPRGADVVLADPPYAWHGWDSLLEDLLALAGLVVLQTGTEVALPPGWDVLRRRRYGTTVVTLARPRK